MDIRRRLRRSLVAVIVSLSVGCYAPMMFPSMGGMHRAPSARPTALSVSGVVGTVRVVSRTVPARDGRSVDLFVDVRDRISDSVATDVEVNVVLAGDEVADSLHGADRAPSQVPRRLSGTRRPDGTVRFTLSAVEVTAHRWQVQLLRAGDATLDPAVTVAEFGPGPPPVHSSGTHAVRTAGWLVVGVMATMMLVSSGGWW